MKRLNFDIVQNKKMAVSGGIVPGVNRAPLDVACEMVVSTRHNKKGMMSCVKEKADWEIEVFLIL